jgi:hypothetical protein
VSPAPPLDAGPPVAEAFGPAPPTEAPPPVPAAQVPLSALPAAPSPPHPTSTATLSPNATALFRVDVMKILLEAR